MVSGPSRPTCSCLLRTPGLESVLSRGSGAADRCRRRKGWDCPLAFESGRTPGAEGVANPELVPDVRLSMERSTTDQVCQEEFLEHVGPDVSGAQLLVGPEDVIAFAPPGQA